MGFSKIIPATKRVLYSLTPVAKLRVCVKFSMIDFVKTPPIFIFQVGKVGSTSIYETLSAMNLGRPIYHAHYLSEQGIKYGRYWHKLHHRKVPASLEYFHLLGKKVRRNLGKAQYTIITGVRDPIAYEISDFFELAEKIDHGCRDENGSLDADLIMSYLINRFQTYDDSEYDFFSTEWFDQELKGTFGIDIYDHPFDHNKGYEVVNCKGLNLLVYQYEKLESVFSAAISELLGLDEAKVPKLKRSNVGKSKWYAALYSEVKENIVVPLDVCKKIYSSKLVKHFYSQEMIDEWTSHWSRQKAP